MSTKLICPQLAGFYSHSWGAKAAFLKATIHSITKRMNLWDKTLNEKTIFVSHRYLSQGSSDIAEGECEMP
jgi:hypothetical protein